MKVFFANVHVSGGDRLQQDGPLLLAVNHPDSFLDAIIVAVHCRRPLYFLARGDAFKSSRARYWLRLLHCIPVYRLSEGKENLHLNAQTFGDCLDILRRKGIVLIFSEGLCENEWRLRPLKKGTARLAFRAWQDPGIGEALQVLPVGITYHSFRRFEKVIFLNAGEMITRREFSAELPEGNAFAAFNERLRQQLMQLAVQFEGTPVQQSSFEAACLQWESPDRRPSEASFPAFKHRVEKMLGDPAASSSPVRGSGPLPKSRRPALYLRLCITALPALAGWLLNYPCWWLLRQVASRTTAGSVYYDSVLFGLLICCYPLYIVLLTLGCFFISGAAWSWIILPAAPLTGWLYMVFRASYRRLQFSSL